MDLVTNPRYPEIILVRTVKALEPFKVNVTFTDGSERTIDLAPFLQGPMFQPIRDDAQVFASVFVDPEGHTLAWPNGADIAPETLYYGGASPWARKGEFSSARIQRSEKAKKAKRKATSRRALTKAA